MVLISSLESKLRIHSLGPKLMVFGILQDITRFFFGESSALERITIDEAIICRNGNSNMNALKRRYENLVWYYQLWILSLL
jgi:hypothetical protein